MENLTSTVDKVENQCKNCGTALAEDHTYCSSCGQHRKESKLSVLKVLGDTFSNLFNIDSRVFHTLKDIYNPAKLTRTYVDGKRKYYMNPARLFLFSLIFLISAMLFNLDIGGLDEAGDNMKQEVYLAEQREKWEEYVAIHETEENKASLAALGDSLFHDINIDSLYLGQRNNIRIANTRVADYKISQKDAVTLTGDELVDKYEIEGFWQRLMIKKYQKLMTNSQQGVKYIIKNLTWVVLVLVFFMAFFMKLLYWRGGYYYVEHLVLLLYSHSMIFLAGIVYELVRLGSKEELNMIGITAGPGMLAILVIQFISLKAYYKQGYFKTLLKMIIINLAYVIMAIVLITLGSVISLMIF